MSVLEDAADELVEANLAYNRADHDDELTDEIELRLYRAQKAYSEAYNAPFREALLEERAEAATEDEE